MRISSSRPYRPVPTPSPVRLMNPLCSARAPRASSGRDDWPLGGGNNHFGVQHAMDRAAFGDVQEPGTLVGGELTVELQLALNAVHQPNRDFAPQAVGGVDALVAHPDRDAAQRPALALGVHAHRDRGAGTESGPEQGIGGAPLSAPPTAAGSSAVS